MADKSRKSGCDSRRLVGLVRQTRRADFLRNRHKERSFVEGDVSTHKSAVHAHRSLQTIGNDFT